MRGRFDLVLRTDAVPRLVAALCIGTFLFISLRHLDSAPPVYEDEPWQASTAYRLMTSGVFGSDLFAGFHDMQDRYYGFMPLHPLLLSVDFRVLGVGLVQARLETVVEGALILLVTFLVGQSLFGAWVGALACVVLTFLRWTGLTYIQWTGIPLIDFSRIARYDPLAALVGLTSLLMYLRARRDSHPLLLIASGVLAGLSGLAHLYGLFWVVALAVLTVWDAGCVRSGARRVAWLLIGAILPWLPYAAYVAADVADWRGQTAGYANRFELLNPAWYLDNLVQEYHRYGPGLGPLGPAVALRIGVWVAFIGVPVALAMLACRAIRRADRSARAIVVPGILLPLLFAVFIHLKLVNYALLELPIQSIALGWLVVLCWKTRRGIARSVVSVVVIAVCLEGGIQLAAFERAAAETPPYTVFAQSMRQFVPQDARILGLHTYWFGFEHQPYRSFLVPLLLADEGMPLDQALEKLPADILLFDSRLRTYFGPDGDASQTDRERLSSWMRRHDAELVGTVDDPTYGRMEIYRLSS
ncbi:MAG: hypothetical protein JOY61_03145 [Chloroflexi bacterium]|nr:hypothetical protein [Chloroflexota bacterium]